MSFTPLVSIIIPVFNRENLIEETLRSVSAQIYKNFECIIVDDGSSDHTEEKVKAFIDTDQRFYFFSRPNGEKKGASACRNYGVKMAKGDYIQFLDSDDLLGESKLFEQVRVLIKEDNLCLTTCKWGYFSQSSKLNNRFKYKYHIYRNFERTVKLLNFMGLFNEFFPPHVYLFSRRLFTEAGPWNEELSNNDDAEFFTRVILKASNIRFVSEAKVYYRIPGSQNLSEFNSEQKVKSAIKSWEIIAANIREEHPFNPTYYVKNSMNNLHHTILLQAPELELKYRGYFQEKKSFNSLYYCLIRKMNS